MLIYNLYLTIWTWLSDIITLHSRIFHHISCKDICLWNNTTILKLKKINSTHYSGYHPHLIYPITSKMPFIAKLCCAFLKSHFKTAHVCDLFDRDLESSMWNEDLRCFINKGKVAMLEGTLDVTRRTLFGPVSFRASTNPSWNIFHSEKLASPSSDMQLLSFVHLLS